MLRTSKAADGRAAAGYNLTDQGAAAIKGRLQSRFDRDLVSDKSRQAKVKELLAGRAAKQAAPVAAKPVAAVAAVTKSAGQAQDDRMRRLGAGTDVDVKRKRDWRQSQVASARNSLVHSREDRASLQQSRDAINHTTRDRELPWMVDGVPITGDPNHRPQVKAPVARYTAARKQKAGQLLKERGERPISEPDRKKAMSIAKRVTKAPSRKQAAPVAAKPAAAPAPAKFSRNGQKAPGRGTADRKSIAEDLNRARNSLNSEANIAKALAKPEWKEIGPGIHKRVPFDINAEKANLARRYDYLNRGEKLRKQAKKSTRLANKSGGSLKPARVAPDWESTTPISRHIAFVAPALPKSPGADFKALATSPSKEGIHKQISDFYGGESKELRPVSGSNSRFTVHSQKDGRDLGTSVIQTVKGYHFGKPPKPAPAPAKFSRNGELAPGRGTAERSAKAAQLGRYRQILPSVDGSATQPRLFSTGPNKTQHLVATVRSSNKYGLMRQRATANKERVSNHFGVGYIIGSGDKRHHNTDFRGRELSDNNRGKEAVKSAIDDLREKRADRPSDPTEARLASPFGLRQIQARAATRVEPAEPKFSRNGAPWRGMADPGYDFRAYTLVQKLTKRSKALDKGDTSLKSSLREQKWRASELRQTRERLLVASDRQQAKWRGEELAVAASYEKMDADRNASLTKKKTPEPKPKPGKLFRPFARHERGSKPRQKEVKGMLSQLKQKRENRATAAGTIPISYKSSVPKGFTAELRPAADAGKNVLLAIKPVSKSFGIQARDKKTQFGVVHSESGKGLTWKNLTQKDATRGAKAADYLARRAERETSVKGVDALLKKPKYIRTLVQFFDRKAIQQ
jgi:hypothetical protein